MRETVTAAPPSAGTRSVLDRLGGWHGVVDGALPPMVFVITNAGAGLVGHGDRAVLLAAAAAGGSALALGAVRLAAGQSMAGVLRGLVGLVVAVAFALWTGRARDFFLPGIYIDGFYAIALLGSVILRRPAVGYAYAALFRVGAAWRDNRRLRRVFAVATTCWALEYALRFAAQMVFYGQDQPELLALAKVALGWPLTAVTVFFTLRAARRVRTGH